MEIDDIRRITVQASRVTWPFTAVSTVLFAIRIYTRLKLSTTKLGCEDTVITVSWILNIIRAVVYQIALNSTQQINYDDFLKTVQIPAFWIIFLNAWVFLSLTLPKLSVGILIIRIFQPERWLKVTIITSCVVLNILGPIGFILSFTQCSPIQAQWNYFEYPEHHCWSRRVQIFYSCVVAGIAGTLDIAFTLYPAVSVWKLNLPIWRKLSTMALMSLGLASVAFTVIKIYYATDVLHPPNLYTLLYDALYIGMWNSIENDFILSAACLPFTPLFFRQCRNYVDFYFQRQAHPRPTSSSIARRSDDQSSKRLESDDTSKKSASDNHLDVLVWDEK